MKTLPTDFKSKGFLFHQVKRVGDVALFERKRPDWRAPQYEVVRVRKYPTYEIGGVTVEAHEAMPPDEAFGKEGWNLATEARAEEIFEREVQNPYTTIMGVAKGGAPGRKRNEFELEVPVDKTFTVNDLHDKYSTQSVAFLHLRLRELIANGKVAKVGEQRSPSGKGKPQNIYSAVPNQQ